MITFLEFINEAGVSGAFKSVNKNLGNAVSAHDYEAAANKKSALLLHRNKTQLAKDNRSASRGFSNTTQSRAFNANHVKPAVDTARQTRQKLNVATQRHSNVSYIEKQKVRYNNI